MRCLGRRQHSVANASASPRGRRTYARCQPSFQQALLRLGAWAEQITEPSQDVLSTLLRRGWRDAHRLLELRNPKPSRLHHSVASRRRVAPKAQKASPPQAPKHSAFLSISQTSRLDNRESCSNCHFVGFVHLSVRCSRKHRVTLHALWQAIFSGIDKTHVCCRVTPSSYFFRDL